MMQQFTEVFLEIDKLAETKYDWIVTIYEHMFVNICNCIYIYVPSKNQT